MLFMLLINTLSNKFDTKNNNDRFVCHDILIFYNWKMLERLYHLTKLFWDFIVYMEGYALTVS